ncbi:hypothetical protein [Vibrio sp. WXL103]|uniref:hypothetical protein n=1 Tax=Vibrio sp. WXL103 TaxID=3450710 RepID=UPI003EC7D39B
MKLINYFLLIISLFCSTFTLASSKGLRYGLSTSVFSYDAYAPEGQAGSTDSFRFSVVHTRPIDMNSARWRWWLSASYLTDHISADPGGVYQELDNFEFRVVPQYAFPIGESITSFVGAGLSLGYSRYSERWEVDSDGYKYVRLPSEQRFDAAAVITSGIVFKMGSDPNAHIQLIPHASYFATYEAHLPGIELGLTVLF